MSRLHAVPNPEEKEKVVTASRAREHIFIATITTLTTLVISGTAAFAWSKVRKVTEKRKKQEKEQAAADAAAAAGPPPMAPGSYPGPYPAPGPGGPAQFYGTPGYVSPPPTPASNPRSPYIEDMPQALQMSGGFGRRRKRRVKTGDLATSTEPPPWFQHFSSRMDSRLDNVERRLDDYEYEDEEDDEDDDEDEE